MFIQYKLIFLNRINKIRQAAQTACYTYYNTFFCNVHKLTDNVFLHK